MKYFGTELSEKHKELTKIIRTKNTVDKAKELFLDIHAELHLSEVSGSGQNRVDELLSDLTPNEYSIMPTSKDETIAWVIWHIARIEDLTMNLLVLRLSKEINAKELLTYRNAVGKQTRHVILHLNDCFKWKQHIRAKKKCFRTN